MWLDAVCPGSWDAVTIEERGHTLARLPYILKAWGGFKVLSVPMLTPWLGPWIARGTGKYQTELAREHDLLGKLFDKLPAVDAATIPAAPEQMNLLPSYWRGYDLKLRYTYRLALDRPLDLIWREANQTTRVKVRKASERLSVASSEDIAQVDRLLAATYRRQGLPPPRLAAVIARILGCPWLEGHRELLIARDEQGLAHAFALLVWDARHSFYVIGGADPGLRSSGAQPLLLWRAIERSHSRSMVFDFEGSMKEGIERAFRDFGAVQTPYVIAMRQRTLLGLGHGLFQSLKRAALRPG
ncbi:GNAT family N-acetyltransferase [Methylobacterium nigriterrae]|uniref:GNAT family N-acetyltransferase n=1 Tax=Methylobacterium nigriterrae TaxID=3127512 RepID=UPI00301411E7